MNTKVRDTGESYEEGKHYGSDESTDIPVFFVLLCVVCMASFYSNVLVYPMTVNMIHSYGNGSETDFSINNTDYLEVTDFVHVNDTMMNVTTRKHKFLSNPQKESLITVSPVGTLFGLPATVAIYNRMGFRRSFVLMAVICVIPSVFLPICTSAQTLVLAIIVRVFQGFSQAAFVPYLCKLSVYLPFSHSSIPSITFLFIQLAALFTFPIAGLLCWSALGWHAVHYGAAILTFAVFVFFIVINYDDEFKEKAREQGICEALFLYERSRSRLLTVRLPYASIYQDFRVWVIIATAFGYFTALHLYLQFGPTFLIKVIGWDVVSTGFLCTIPAGMHIFVSFLLLAVFNKLSNSSVNKMRFFNSVSFFVPGVLFMLIGFFDPVEHKSSLTALFLIGCSFLGFSSVGFFRMAQKRSVQYHLFFLLNLFAVNAASMFLASVFNVLIAKDDDYSGWSAVFVLHGAILIVTNIIFCVFASDDAAVWTADGYEDNSLKPQREDPLPHFPL